MIDGAEFREIHTLVKKLLREKGFQYGDEASSNVAVGYWLAEQQRGQPAVSDKGWIGVDLDATLAFYDGWIGAEHIGEPVPLMAERVRKWVEEGREVRIFTARANLHAMIAPIQEWSLKHFGVKLAVTSVKDFKMIELWDDRCVQVQPNTGEKVQDFWTHSLTK